MYSFLEGWCREKLRFYMHKLGFSVSWDVRVISVQSTCSTLTLNIFAQLIPYGNKKLITGVDPGFPIGGASTIRGGAPT